MADDAVAWVCEDVGDPTLDEDGHTPLGLFSAHVERGDRIEEGPERAAAGEAIAWARERAGTVIVRCNESWENTFYSAGDTPAVGEDGRAMPAWPAGGLDLGRRRLPGWEHLDRTSDDEPIEWEVVIGTDVVPQPEGFADGFEAALRADSAVEVVAVSISEPPDVAEGEYAIYSGSTVRMHVRTTGRTLAEAVAAATSAAGRAIDAALLPDSSRPYIFDWQGDAYPVGSIAASYNAHL